MSRYMGLFQAIGGDVTSQCQPFVFTPVEGVTGEIPQMLNDEILAAPFPVFCYEIENGYVTRARDSISNTTCIAVVMVKELLPDVYKFTLFMGDGEIIIVNYGEDAYTPMYNITGVYIKRLHVEKRGSFKGVGRVKYRDDSGAKCTYKPRNIIYVSGNVAASVTGGGNNVRHLNSWSVMGHWRRIGGMGVDRTGVRNVQGYTWVKSHDKGDGSIKLRRIS